ncbi:cytochrome P450 [Streptomyces sp. NPDC000987]|uniref:cytochrome P450 n=1 Tax=Streptomyces sp. NPDC000987 TaxID=3154374 RepID=UPI00331C3620
MQSNSPDVPRRPEAEDLAEALGAEVCPAGFPVIGARMLRDPAALGTLRDAGIARVSLGGGENGWMVARYDAASALLKEPGLRGEHPLAQTMRTAADEEVCDEEMLFFLPTEEHLRLRRLISRQLTHRRVGGLVPRIRQEADRLLDEVPHSEPIDLVQSFCRPFPVAVLCELLGIPMSERRYIRNYVYGWVAEYGEASSVTKQAGIELADYLRELVAERRKSPGDDLISAMVSGDDADTLEEDVLSAVRLLLIAGHRPMTRLLTEGVELLLGERDRWDRLRRDPDWLEPVTEELLRYVTPTTLASRYAEEEVEVEGVTLAPGTGVHCALAGVNRDPAHFENPDTFDPDRSENRHVAFGLGHKHCLGAALTRAEVRVALETLTTRFPQMVLADVRLSGEPQRRQLPVVLRPETCPVRH